MKICVYYTTCMIGYQALSGRILEEKENTYANTII